MRNPFLALSARTRPRQRVLVSARFTTKIIFEGKSYFGQRRAVQYTWPIPIARAPPPLFISVRVRRAACDTHGQSSLRRSRRRSSPRPFLTLNAPSACDALSVHRPLVGQVRTLQYIYMYIMYICKRPVLSRASPTPSTYCYGDRGVGFSRQID